jgi:uncharacterized membrane protein (UPF0182 family)
LPAGLEEHLRYPQDLFRVQGELYLEYHVTDSTELFTGNDKWSLPKDPSTINRRTSSRSNVSTGEELLWGDGGGGGLDTTFSYRAEILPYYLLSQLPGEDSLSYLLLQPFTPSEKRNMSAFLVADSTPGRYGRLLDFRMPQGELVDGTEQVGQRIEQNGDISQQFTLWDSQGSSVVLGDLLVVPVEDSVIYVQPVFLEAEGGGFPEFRRVIVVYGDKVRWAESLNEALFLVFGESSDTGTVDPTPTPDGATVEELLEQAAAAFDLADEALQNGNLADYQRWVDEAQRLIDEAVDLAAGAVEAFLGMVG